jgi:hypothetical protein
MTDLPSHDLELKAAVERHRLHDAVEELRSQIREELDVKNQARQHLGLACSVAMFLGLTAGYSLTGFFVHR